GTCYVYALPKFPLENNTDTTAIFYYWGGSCDASMNWNNAPEYLINSGSNINADYKTSMITTSSDALKNANQVKVLKDRNGVTNLIYESMQGIFYTRTRPDGKFKSDEILSKNGGYATFNNKNPHLSEAQPYGQINPEINMYASWEKKEGQNIKIMTSGRNVLGITDRHYWVTAEFLTLNNVPENFEALPKYFVASSNDGQSIAELRVLTYLKPEGNARRLYGYVKTTNWIEATYPITEAGNIHEYAIASRYEAGKFYLHIAYRKDQTIYYKLVSIGQSTPSIPWYNTESSDVPISNDISGFRSSVDIALKNVTNNSNNINMQPVVTYQGSYSVRIIISGGNGQPTEIAGTYYPIYVRERIASCIWSSSSFVYNSLNIVQQTPIIEGSKLGNSCIVNYTNNSTNHRKVVPRWDGTTVYSCDPNQYNGTDARLIKYGVVDNNSTNQRLITLAPSTTAGDLFEIGKQDFVVQMNQSPGYEAITG